MSSLLRVQGLKTCFRLPIKSFQILSRTFVKVGDEVPVNYLKDAKNPKIKADSEYPDWLLTLAKSKVTKAQLLEIYDKNPEELSIYQIKRLKKFMILEKVRAHNEANSKKK